MGVNLHLMVACSQAVEGKLAVTCRDSLRKFFFTDKDLEVRGFLYLLHATRHFALATH